MNAGFPCDRRRGKNGLGAARKLGRSSHAELKNLVVALFEQVAGLWRTIAAQAEEIARRKGGPRRPTRVTQAVAIVAGRVRSAD